MAFLMVLTLSIRASLENYPVIWESGKEIMTCRVLLGQNEKSSNCELTLADPTGSIAEALIKHSLTIGGIPALPSPQPTPTPTSTGSSSTSGGGTGLTTLTPERRAFLAALAEKESNGRYNVINGGATFTDYSKHPFEGSDQILGFGVAAGAYQFMPGTWKGLRQRNRYPDFSPPSQDQAAIDYIRELGVLGLVDAGDALSAARRLRRIWTSLPGAAESQWTETAFLAFYQERLRFFQGGGSSGTTPGVGAGAATAMPGKQNPSSSSTLTPAQPEPVFKGAKLTIEVSTGSNTDPFQFVFYHQGTYTQETGVTQIVGQGIRWVLNRRRRNEGHSNQNLRQLAESIARSQGLQLEWTSVLNPSYEYLDQSGISDYQLLLREAERAGLFISESNGKLTVKQLDQVRDIDLTLAPGLNLISYRIEDRAIDTTNDDASSLEPQAAKYDLDPITGQFKQKQPDVDPVTDKSTTGKAQQTPTGTLKPGDEAVVDASRKRVKRVKGLPSTFTLPLSESTLVLQPLDAVRTLGLPGVLARIWLVDSVSHTLHDGITTIECYSPVEALDQSPQALAPGSPPTNASGGYIYPMRNGTVTDVRRWRSSTRFHSGYDISTGGGEPILAMQQGIVTTVVRGCVVGDTECGGRYGNYVVIRHPDGYSTLYAHLSAVNVNQGQTVRQGQTIGTEGNTGSSTGPHLHLEVIAPDGSRVNMDAIGLKNPVTGDQW